MGETARISETITFNFATAEQQRRFHAVLAGNEDLTSNYFGRNQPGPWELLTKEQTEELMEAIKRQAIDDCIKVVRERAAELRFTADECRIAGARRGTSLAIANANHRAEKYEVAADILEEELPSRLEALKGEKT